MIDFERLRQSMVDSQIRPNDVTDPRVLAALLEVPRERFAPAARTALAYLDDDLPVRDEGPAGPPRYLMEPMILARIIQALSLSGAERVLDVGCATGYSTALLAKLAGSVVGLESDPELATTARRVLAELASPGVKIVQSPLTTGHQDDAPYDGILINGSVEVVPERLLAQLGEGGRLVAVVRSGPLGRATLHLRSGGVVSTRHLFDASAPLLPGFEATRGFVF